MEKLNREERGKIASVLIQSISKLCNVPCGASYDDIGYEEQKKHIRYYARYLHISLDFWMKEKRSLWM